MLYRISKKNIRDRSLERIEEISGQSVFDCYQCGNCSSGCPFVDYMDLTPNQVLRLAQFGQIERILASETIWVCSTCLQCSTRCPKGIDVAKLMEAFRTVKLRKRAGQLDPYQIDVDDLRELPPIALVGCFRKKTA